MPPNREIHIFHHVEPGNEVPTWATLLLTKVGLITSKLDQIMATLDQILADVVDEHTKIEGLITLLNGIKQQLADALAGTTLPPEVQAKIDAVFDGVEVNKAAIVAALDANTPPSPTP